MGEIDPIPTDGLNATNVPSADADYHGALEPFCLTFDGYAGGRRSIEECIEIANRLDRDGLARASLDDLRIAAFVLQRKIRWNDQGPPDSELVREVRKVIAEIRRRVTGKS